MEDGGQTLHSYRVAALGTAADLARAIIVYGGLSQPFKGSAVPSWHCQALGELACCHFPMLRIWGSTSYM